MTMGQGASLENKQKFAEVFTPASIAFEMELLPEMRDALQDVDTPICDPCVGQGQFTATALVLKMFYNLDKLDGRMALRALWHLYGVDIQHDSIDECRTHLFATLTAAFEFFTGYKLAPLEIMYARAIVEHNFIQGDSLNDWANCLDRLDLHYLAEKVRSNHAAAKKPERKRDDRQLTLF